MTLKGAAWTTVEGWTAVEAQRPKLFHASRAIGHFFSLLGGWKSAAATTTGPIRHLD